MTRRLTVRTCAAIVAAGLIVAASGSTTSAEQPRFLAKEDIRVYPV